ncbi:MogA/MoaB family molybdenum cofactor biosynthesis protein [Brevibacterium samyangense]|uniref:MogA/MoaB family molybdenum cofactor biosynthesis protein n=1 Tax=Brevibacterium samyangense TaxID=366888 RepID=A0ABP5ETA7_9MICO
MRTVEAPRDAAGPTVTDPARSPFGRGRSAAVLVSSTHALTGQKPDLAGPVLAEWLRALGYACAGPRVLDDGPPMRTAIELALGVDSSGVPLSTVPEAPLRVLVTCGGTGLGPLHRVPEYTAPLLDVQAPGIMHALWRRGLENTEHAVLSRGVAGVRGSTFVVNLPGSKGGAMDGIAVLEPLLPNIQTQIEDACE